MPSLRRLLATLVVASSLVATLAASADAASTNVGIVDRGSFKIFRRDKALGAETFEYMDAADSLVVRARQYLMLPSAQGDEAFEKGADILLTRENLALEMYQSNRKFHGVETIRALVFSDTHYVAYREKVGGSGEGDARVLPPGHVYVMDSQLVSLFDIMCRSFPAGSFPSRPINLLALGPRDTLLNASAATLGNEVIRWGGKPVTARKIQLIADSQTTFTFWVGPDGHLLRLSEPLGGLRAERDPPAVKRRPASPPPKPKPGG